MTTSKPSKVDEILATIDAGLQSTAEASYGESPWDGARTGPKVCARCLLLVPPDDADLCTPCRAYLLGDTDYDPADPTRDDDELMNPHIDVALLASVGETAEIFAERVAALGQQLAEILRPIADIVLAMPDDVRDLILGRRPITDDEVARLEAAVLALDTEEEPVWTVRDDAFADLEEGTVFTLDGFDWLVDRVDHTTTPPTFHLIAPPEPTP